MSADRWNICPKCEEIAAKKNRLLAAEVEEKYGKIPLEEWLKLRSKPVDDVQKQTLREDWELDLDRINADAPLTLEVSYNAHCDVCGFTVKYHRIEKIHDIANI